MLGSQEKGSGKTLPGVQALVCRASVGRRFIEKLSTYLTHVTRLSALHWGYLFAKGLPFFPRLLLLMLLNTFCGIEALTASPAPLLFSDL